MILLDAIIVMIITITLKYLKITWICCEFLKLTELFFAP